MQTFDLTKTNRMGNRQTNATSLPYLDKHQKIKNIAPQRTSISILENNDLEKDGRINKRNLILNKIDFKQPEYAAGLQSANDI